MEKIRLALDWTPNINHIGFFIAQEKGFYQNQGLEVQIIDPSQDNYARTPAKKVELGQADLALCPSESVISYRTKTKPFPLIGIATIFQQDLSAIAVKAQSEIKSPRGLDGRSYASYQARYEDQIVKQMIQNDGGKGDLMISYPQKLGIWDTILSDNYDATWIFVNWEGVEAEALEVPLTLFRMEDYGIPYGYSPLLVVDENALSSREEALCRFLTACRKSYLFASEHPEEAIELLKPFIPPQDAKIDLNQALALSIPAFGDQHHWGKMDAAKMNQFLDWIYNKQLETKLLKLSDLINSELICKI
ncbi:MAG: ABC transporter substrate-binding protein [Bacteroidota bacterium]